jgi:hypothetical protein
MTKLNTSHSCKDEIETEDKWGEKAQSLSFKAEMHNLQTPATLKSPLCTCTMAKCNMKSNSSTLKPRNGTSQKPGQITHNWLIMAQNLHHRPLTQNTLQYTITYQFRRDSSCVCIQVCDLRRADNFGTFRFLFGSKFIILTLLKLLLLE